MNVGIEGRTVGLRYGEIKLSAPLGFASYATTGGLRKIEYRVLPPLKAGISPRGKQHSLPAFSGH